MIPNSKDVDALQMLVSDNTSDNETKCREYLKFAHPLLVHPLNQGVNVIDVEEEQPSVTGRSDYFLLCEKDFAVKERRRIYVWELKAPQHYVFEVETKNRAVPSVSLMEAENQLLHYLDEYKKSGAFKDLHEIRGSDDIVAGGIIIGRDDRLVKVRNGLVDRAKADKLAGAVERIRNTYFYRDSLRIVLWSQILRFVENRVEKET